MTLTLIDHYKGQTQDAPLALNKGTDLIHVV
jgi:hypothetical protein